MLTIILLAISGSVLLDSLIIFLAIAFAGGFAWWAVVFIFFLNFLLSLAGKAFIRF